MDDLISEYLTELLDEAKVSSPLPVVTQTSKIKRAVGQMANNQAKKRNDPLYQRMIKYKELYYRYRNLIHQKYGGRVRSDARK